MSSEGYAPHQLGRMGEEAAASYLQSKGMRLLERNYRYRRNEIDLIARDGATLCFIEVKTRLSTAKGHPLEAVTTAKQREIIKAATAYLSFDQNPEQPCRFDVVAITVPDGDGTDPSTFRIEHIRDAFMT